MEQSNNLEDLCRYLEQSSFAESGKGTLSSEAGVESLDSRRSGIRVQSDQRTFYRKVLLIQLGKDADRAPRKVNDKDNRKVNTGGKGTVLLVDDDSSTLEFSTVVLQAHGYNTFTAQSAKEAREILHSSSSISLIITDLRMPLEDGFSILQYLRNNLRFCHIPAIMLTSYSNEEMVRRAMELGARDFITKPFGAETLIGRVRKVLEETKCTALVVSADSLHQSILTRTLNSVGIQTSSVTTGDLAKEMLTDKSISLIISELALSDMTGLDLMIAAQEIRPTLPFVFLGDPLLRVTDDDIRAAGGFGLIPRPFTNIDILHAVRAVCPM